MQCHVLNQSSDILLIAESWLDSQETFLYKLKGYTALHSCRDGIGGGVSIYVKEEMEIIELEQSKQNELVNWTCIKVLEHNLIISLIYRPPSYSYLNFLNQLENIFQKYPKNHLIVGDFNINLLDLNSLESARFKNLVFINNFQIKNTISNESATRIATNSRSIIDLVLIDKNCKYNCKVIVTPISFSDHNQLLIDIIHNRKVAMPKINYEFKAINHIKFKSLFENKICDNNTITSFGALTDLITSCKSRSEYVKSVRSRQNYWMDQEVLNLMKDRDRLYKIKIRKPNDVQIAENFNVLKNKINNKIRVLKNRHFKNEWEQTGTNSRRQWQFINRLVKEGYCETKINSLIIDDTEIQDKDLIVNKLNEHFTEIGTNIMKEVEAERQAFNYNIHNNEINIGNSCYLEYTNEAEVLEVILELKPNSAPGHDQISVKDILNLQQYITPILKVLIDSVFTSGIFPDELKVSKMSPIYKAGAKTSPNNYRPISVLSVFSKILEKIIKKRMLSFIEKFIQVDKYQYGFIKNSNTLSATVDFVDFISRALDKSQLVVAVFIDLKKAFDVVDISLLLEKLSGMGFRGAIHGLIETYLINRQQYVKLNKYSSGFLISRSGVPQGSVLGPLLYSLYVLSLKYSRVNARYFTFADDTVLVYTGNDENDLCFEVNADLKKYMNWLYCNKLKINSDKTKYILFKQKNKITDNITIQMNNVSIEQVSHIKYLGLVVDDKLTWSMHMNYMREKILPIIPALFKHRYYLTKKSKYNVYNAFVLPHLRYLIPVWGSGAQCHITNIITLQNTVVKILFNFDRLTNSDMLYRELNISPIIKIYEFEQDKLMHKILKQSQKSNINIVLSNDVHQYNTRSNCDIYQTVTKTNIGLNNPIVRASKSYNKLPGEIKNISNFNTFVIRLKHYLDIG